MTGAIHRQANGSTLSTMRIGGQVHVVDISVPNDVPEAISLATRLGLRFMPLGGGSNIVFPDGDTPLLVALMGIQDIQAIDRSDGTTLLTCGAGVVWDDIVEAG